MSYMSAGNIVFDPAQSQVLYCAEGIGIWYTMNPFTNEPTWISQSAAIEQLVLSTNVLGTRERREFLLCVWE